MENCQIQERTNKAKVLYSKPSIVTLKKPTVKEIEEEEETISEEELLASLNNAFREVKLMIDGKMKKQTLDELLYELRNTKDEEFCQRA